MMKKYKYISIAIILILFVIFSVIQIYNSYTYDVVEVICPTEIVVDKNKNGVADDNESVKLLQGYSVLTKFSESDNLAKYLKIDDYTRYAFAFLTEKFASEVLLDKKVDLKKIGGVEEVLLYGEKYSDIIKKSGYLFKDNKPVNEYAFKKRLEQIKKAEYKLYNAKSNKYHLLTCEYGLKAHSYVLLSKNQLPKGASPCKYCLGDKVNVKHLKSKSINNKSKYDIKSPQQVFVSGSIKVMLTDHTRNLIPNRLGNTAVCNEIVNHINNAKSTIDIAIYGYDRVPKIENAIKNAISRGVQVRLVHDIDSGNSNIYENTMQFASIIKNVSCDKAPEFLKEKNKYTNSIMHDKFYIFDKSVVITGSANLSHTDMSAFNSNAVIVIKSAKIAQLYTNEFEQMYNSKFHNLKSHVPNKENISVGNSTVSIYFSPTDLITQKVILPLINNSTKYIYMPIFLITDNSIAAALINAKSRGVDVKVIVDATNAKNSYSKHSLLRQRGIAVKTENYAGKMHSKSIIVDDKYTLIGSMNLSRSGNTKNDENVVLIKDPGITVFYRKFFEYLWNRISDYWLTHDVSAESIYSIGSCSDGIDNDYDGKTDNADEGCRAVLKKKN